MMKLNQNAKVVAVLAGVSIGGLAVLQFAGAGPLDPPAGPVEPTGRTLDEIYDKLLTIEQLTGGNAIGSSREVAAFVSVATSAQLPGTGRVIVHSFTASWGNMTVTDANSLTLGRVVAQPYFNTGNNTSPFRGSNQVLLDVEMELPITIERVPGSPDPVSATVVFTRLD